MTSDKTSTWTSTEVFKLYKDNGGHILSKCAVVQQLSELFGKELVVLSAVGLANILVFWEKVHNVLQVGEDEEDDMSIGKVAKQIIKESKKLSPDKTSYCTRINRSMATREVSYTLKCLLSSISDKLGSTLPALLIGNIITSVINNQPTSLQVALGFLVREKKLLVEL